MISYYQLPATETEEFKLTARCKDLTGQRFGMLIALKPVRLDSEGQVLWYCKCDCGNFSLAQSSRLIIGSRKSCHCLVKGKRLPLPLKHATSRCYQAGCRCRECIKKHTSYWNMQMEKNYRRLHRRLDMKLRQLGRTDIGKFNVRSHPKVCFLGGL